MKHLYVFRRFAPVITAAWLMSMVSACADDAREGSPANGGSDGVAPAEEVTPPSANPAEENPEPAEREDPRALALFHGNRCATCHGRDANGSRMAPPIRGLGDWWTETMLVEYLTDPKAFAAANEAFDARRDIRYKMPMPAYGELSPEDLQTLARWMLSRPAAEETDS